MPSHHARRAGIAALAAALLLPVPAAPAQETPAQQTPAAGTAAPIESGIRGRVVSGDGTPLAGAVVRASSLQTGEETASAPTDRKGEFELSGLPHGYYDLAVETGDGLFAGNRVINVPPSGFGIVQLRIGASAADTDNSAYGSRADGRATVERRLNRREFWRSPKGVAILAGVGGAGLLWLAASDGSNRFETPASPF